MRNIICFMFGHKIYRGLATISCDRCGYNKQGEENKKELANRGEEIITYTTRMLTHPGNYLIQIAKGSYSTKTTDIAFFGENNYNHAVKEGWIIELTKVKK